MNLNTSKLYISMILKLIKFHLLNSISSELANWSSSKVELNFGVTNFQLKGTWFLEIMHMKFPCSIKILVLPTFVAEEVLHMLTILYWVCINKVMDEAGGGSATKGATLSSCLMSYWHIAFFICCQKSQCQKLKFVSICVTHCFLFFMKSILLNNIDLQLTKLFNIAKLSV